jgi:hypothetical protein
MRRVLWRRASTWDGTPLREALRDHAAVGVRGALDAADAAGAASSVLRAEGELVDDFGGEQRALGRAFYTHLETGRARDYFAAARASDAVVERVLPGMQQRTLELLGRLLGGVVRRRHGFCGPGVHVFPPGEKVARRGGVTHYDLEGLSAHHLDGGAAAVSFVWMLQPPTTRGGLRLFPRVWRGRDWPLDRAPPAAGTTTRSRAGDALLFSSYRLHRIEGFGGDRARVSVTCHAVEVDDDVWEAWF